MKYFNLLILNILSLTVLGQTGLVGDPFTSLNQAAGVSTAGIYYFNLGGTTFDTHIDANGYVQIALDFGNGIGNLPQSTSVSISTRGILSPTVLATLTEILEVRMSSSSGNFDVTTSNSTIISRIQSNITLHRGSVDNGINNNWVGVNSVFMTANASCNTSSGNTLNQNIVHMCGNTLGTHWIPSSSLQMERHTDGNIGNSESLHLWVKGNASCSGATITSLAQAAFIKVPGIYCFNIGGTTFDTYVDANGYVQIAIDFGNGAGNLPQSTSLNTSSRGILTPTVLSALTETGEVRISSTTGNIDVVTTDASIVARIISNSTLHKGVVDNGINNGWTGVNSIFMTANASCNTSSGSTLNQNIVHICGNTLGTHWISSSSLQRDRHTDGDIGSTEYLQLWVRENTSPLPIRLLNFDAFVDEEIVQLNWKTAAEINNDYFVVERSLDGQNWEEVLNQSGAGNSSMIIEYDGIDVKPFVGVSYYRLKQIDFDGKFTYSKIKVIKLESNQSSQIKIYPNPSSGQVTIQGSQFEIEGYRFLNLLGNDITDQVKVIQSGERLIVLDISSLPSGVYLVKTKTQLNKVFKK